MACRGVGTDQLEAWGWILMATSRTLNKTVIIHWVMRAVQPQGNVETASGGKGGKTHDLEGFQEDLLDLPLSIDEGAVLSWEGEA